MSQYTKYKLYKLQQRISGSSDTWIDVVPTTYSYDGNGTQTPVIVEEQSADCGYVPPIEPIYKWENMNINTDYICEGTTKYYKQQRYVSYDNGNTWQPLSEYRKGALYQEDSEDCGYSVVYKWENVIGEYTCSGCTKYQKTQKYASYDGGTTWSAVSPAEYGIGDVIEYGSEDCGCSTQYRWWAIPSSSEYICSGTSKYTKEYYQVSYDGGSTWQNVVPQQTRAGELIESASTDCGYIQPIYRTLSTATTCVGYDKYTLTEYQVSYDEGFSWSTTASSATTLIEHDSEDCGYVPPTPQSCNVITYTANSKLNESYNTPTDYQVNTLRVKAFYGIDNNLLNMTSHTFENGVGTITFNGEIIKIINDAFQGCYGLTNVNIPNCVTSIGNYAFSGCSSLASIVIPSGVTYISQYIFNSCTSLTSCTMGSGVTRIGYNAFQNCSSLTSIDIPSGVTIIDDGVFYGCTSLTSVTIPSGVTSISNVVFEDCTSLTSFTIHENVTSIGTDAFRGCTSLTTIDIPNSVTTIGQNAFAYCTSLTTCTIGSGMTYIRNYAFQNCTNLASITIKAITPPRIDGKSVFANTNDCPIYVPAASVNAYKSATYWSSLNNRIQAIP